MTRRGEEGFTLIELLFAMVLLSILLGLGVNSLRVYWWNQQLIRAEDSVVAQLTQIQDQSVSESNPLTYGARFRLNTGTFDLVRFDGATNACTKTSDVVFDPAITVTAVDFPNVATLTSECRGDLGAPAGDKFAFFFPRGTATGGSITLTSSRVGKSKTITVTPITGKVEGS
ncbi:MAG: hypothetical protein QOG54_1691 [Actinomycetota bacterium]|nr:hypothetical protein [Actinomycetota bacterium]